MRSWGIPVLHRRKSPALRPAITPSSSEIFNQTLTLSQTQTQNHSQNQIRSFPPSSSRRPWLHTATPRPGKAEVYGAIIKSRSTSKYCLVQGKMTGKWSFPKGHVKELDLANPNAKPESPFECVSREVAEEIGIDHLPMPIRGLPLRVGYYYIFEVSAELELNPRDLNEIGTAGWFSLEEMRTMNMNIDASYFRSQYTARNH